MCTCAQLYMYTYICKVYSIIVEDYACILMLASIHVYVYANRYVYVHVYITRIPLSWKMYSSARIYIYI